MKIQLCLLYHRSSIQYKDAPAAIVTDILTSGNIEHCFFTLPVNKQKSAIEYNCK